MAEFDFNAYVKGLSQEKLAELIIQFAPETFREEIRYQHLDKEKAKDTYDQISNRIKDLFEDEELLYDPSEFEDSLVSLSEKLSGLWDRFPEETGHLFLFCLKKIEEVQDEGLLYRHYPEEIFDGNSFLTVIQRYAASLPFNQKMEFIGKLEKIIEAYSYITFYSYANELHLIFKDSEKELLKDWFFESLRLEERPFHKHYYQFLKDIFNLEEKALVLEKIYHQDKSLCLDLTETLVELQKPETAIQYLESLKEANPDPWVFTEDLFLRLVQLKKAEGKPIQEDLISGLMTYKTNTLLEKSIEFCPERSLEMESIVKSASHYFFLKYLIGKNRIDEAHQLVLASKTLDEQSVLNFFKRHCEKYPVDSTNYFIKLIDKELPYTGDRHYESIITSLHYIRKVSPQRVVEITGMLKRDYKRRRNLMAMLDREF